MVDGDGRGEGSVEDGHSRGRSVDGHGSWGRIAAAGRGDVCHRLTGVHGQGTGAVAVAVVGRGRGSKDGSEQDDLVGVKSKQKRVRS